MSVPAVIGFSSTWIFSAFTIAFAFAQSKSSLTVLRKQPVFYCTLGSLLLVITIIIEMILCITRNQPTWQVRLAALDLTFVFALVVLMISVVRHDNSFSDWKSTPQILIYMAWLFMLVNIICNLIIFSTEACV